jgi:hypothetical protein
MTVAERKYSQRKILMPVGISRRSLRCWAVGHKRCNRQRRLKMSKFLKIGLIATAAMVTIMTSGTAMARRGADDAPGDVRQCRGCDDPAGHVRQGRGADDPAGHVRRGRGTDDTSGDDRRGRERGRGTDDAPGDDRGRGRGGDDPRS